MATKPPPPLEDVVQQMNGFFGEGLKREVGKNVRGLAEAALGKLNVVTREEYDAQVDVLHRTQAQVAELEQQLAELTAELDAREQG